MAYSVAVFDMDGTILYTLDDLCDAVNVGLASQGYPLRSVAEVRTFVGDGIRKLIERAVPAGTDKAATDRVHAAFTAYYDVHCADKTRPYDGIVPLLSRLRERGIQTALVSNKEEGAMADLVQRFFPGLFDVAVGDRPGLPKKPAPDGVNLALSTLQADKTSAVFIGDSDVDYRTAVNAGLPCISVTWGFRDRDLLESLGSTLFADTPADVERLIVGVAE